MSGVRANRPPRGAISVGRLTDLDPVEAGAVLYLRLCSDAVDPEEAILRDFTNSLGNGAGPAAARSFCDLCDLCQRHARRPLCRHHLNCACLGADEACFAQMVAAAAEGAREDALMMAMLIVRADLAPLVAGLAQDAGLALRRMALRVTPARQPTHPPATALH